MSRTIYALFVGIDRYAGKVNPLNGGGRGKHDRAAAEAVM